MREIECHVLSLIAHFCTYRFQTLLPLLKKQKTQFLLKTYIE